MLGVARTRTSAEFVLGNEAARVGPGCIVDRADPPAGRLSHGLRAAMADLPRVRDEDRDPGRSRSDCRPVPVTSPQPGFDRGVGPPHRALRSSGPASRPAGCDRRAVRWEKPVLPGPLRRKWYSLAVSVGMIYAMVVSLPPWEQAGTTRTTSVPMAIWRDARHPAWRPDVVPGLHPQRNMQYLPDRRRDRFARPVGEGAGRNPAPPKPTQSIPDVVVILSDVAVRLDDHEGHGGPAGDPAQRPAPASRRAWRLHEGPDLRRRHHPHRVRGHDRHADGCVPKRSSRTSRWCATTSRASSAN